MFTLNAETSVRIRKNLKNSVFAKPYELESFLLKKMLYLKSASLVSNLRFPVDFFTDYWVKFFGWLQITKFNGDFESHLSLKEASSRI